MLRMVRSYDAQLYSRETTRRATKNTHIWGVCRASLTHPSHPVKLNVSTTMAISAELLEILVCPACRARVELKPDETGLKCISCHRVYPIRDEIPVMLIDEATIDE